MSSLSALIDEVRLKKKGSTEFALFGFDDLWRAMIGNPTGVVLLGEVDGEFSADAATPEAAVEKLLQMLP